MNKLLYRGILLTLPVFCGYLFLGLAFGLLLEKAGYDVVWAFFISLIVYAGAMQFVMISFLDGGLSLLSVAIMTLSINSRHMFYGLSFIEKFKNMGKSCFYMIFSLTDETYSLLCSLRQDNLNSAENNKKLFLLIALLNQSYWIFGSCLGSVVGELINFDTTGIDFAMTALFVVIFIEQYLQSSSHIPAIIGLSCGIICLLIFGPQQFILPALVATVSALLLCQKRIVL